MIRPLPDARNRGRAAYALLSGPHTSIDVLLRRGDRLTVDWLRSPLRARSWGEIKQAHRMSLHQSPANLRPPIGRAFLPSGAALSAGLALAIYFAEAMSLYFAIGIGSALGGIARFWCSGLAARMFGETFPWGTLLVNVVGSLIIGFFSTLTGPDGRMFVGSTARQFVMVGICGGYTTFSSFSLQTLNLMNDGQWLQAGANVGASVVLCLLAVWIGHVLAVALNTMKLA